METFNSDRVKATKSCQANRQISAASIITQLKKAHNQIRTHSGRIENSIEALARLREGDTNNK